MSSKPVSKVLAAAITLAFLSQSAIAQTPQQQYKGIMLLFPSIPADQTTYKAVLMLYAPNTLATDQPTQTMLWGQNFADPAQTKAIADERLKELNANMTTSKWSAAIMPLGNQTNQPIKTLIWPKLYTDIVTCTSEVGAKTAELNSHYIIAGTLDRWQSSCVPVQ